MPARAEVFQDDRDTMIDGRRRTIEGARIRWIGREGSAEAFVWHHSIGVAVAFATHCGAERVTVVAQ